ncbi:MAG: YggT family protein [Acidimicrobiales bacterium]|jgi:YggT family protein|nr:YggT family protein [Acidimicrobiales bacterium]|tara:strand:- start:411 stop:668 length:258 start_codon:yes stop_codon:yes gene_type:complete
MSSVICLVLQIYVLLILVRVVFSWFPVSPHGTAAVVSGFLSFVTDPVLRPLRKVLPPIRFGSALMDLSPIVAFFGITLLQNFICG